MIGELGLLDAVQDLLQALGALRWWLAAGLLCAAGLAGSAAVWWRRRAVAELARRVTFDVIPAKSFDPSPEEVERRAAQLERGSQAAVGVPRRARAVRLRMAAENGELLTQVQGHVYAAGLLQRTPYSDVEVVESRLRGRRGAPRVRLEGAAPQRRTKGRS
jgi:hypothetical protein